jgi:lipopolysaccharide transport system ATP-binding protein
MTGRENIFLNGAILGMTKREIGSKIDEIIAFSGCERYIDTPVKRYSSGMTVRLAFAVAAHLEPEILVIDEVLAVGDAEFQKKAIGKMQDISKGEGRTVLFVSHNMAAVKSLCKTGIVLENGCLTFQGTSEECVGYYLNDSGTHASNFKRYDDSYAKELFTLHSIGVKNVTKSFDDTLVENLGIELIISIDFKMIPDNYHITYHLYNELGEALFSFYDSKGDAKLKMGTNQLICTIPADFFQSGNYSLALFIVKDKRTAVFVERDIFGFTVVDGGRELGVYMGREPGFIRPQFKWSVQ